MKININEIKITITNAREAGRHPNLLAYVTLIFQAETGEHLSISGFTLWKSKYGGYNVEMPGKKKFKYCLCEKSLWRKIKQEVIEKYDYENIPIVEEDEKK